ncbi:MAG TPA: hypothetical protein VEW28_06665 [Candidatus Kapabacteria bacterium]|nr:hypothetical protein [Candidatus Kapabacteria bacterium]
MKKVIGIVMAIVAVMLLASSSQAQRFVEQPDQWKTTVIRASGADTMMIERHSSFVLDAINDTLPLIYHEPNPDGVMPRAGIEIAEITIQAGSADEVVAMLEKQARKIGADWIVGFNEPRLKWQKIGGDMKVTYRSTALLYRVFDPELIPEQNIVTVDCSAKHLTDCKAVLTWLDEENKGK